MRTLELDELFDTVNDVEVVVFVHLRHVASVQPPVLNETHETEREAYVLTIKGDIQITKHEKK